MVYVSLVAVVAVWAFLKLHPRRADPARGRRKPRAAHALGYKVVRIRMLAILFGGACAGLGGAY